MNNYMIIGTGKKMLTDYVAAKSEDEAKETFLKKYKSKGITKIITCVGRSDNK